MTTAAFCDNLEKRTLSQRDAYSLAFSENTIIYTIVSPLNIYFVSAEFHSHHETQT